MLFSKKEKNKQMKELLNNKPLTTSEMYLECVDYYVNYQGKLRNIENPTDNKKFYEEIVSPFYNSAMHFVNYLESTYTDDTLNNDEVIELDLNKMIDGANKTVLQLFSSPTFPDLIYINSIYSTHFHTDGNHIIDTEGVEVLPGLSSIIANKKINKIFNGLTPIEARELLKQMNIYPSSTELDEVINIYREKQKIQQVFYKSIICLLLIRKNNYAIKRARLFADNLGVPFDFSYFEKELEQRKLKHYT